jgi:hypothetical protein
MRRTGLGAALSALVLTAALAASALADTTTALSGDPLTVYVGERGQLQAFRAGSATGIFYAPTSQVGDAGFFLAFPSGFTADDTPRVFGFTGIAGPRGLDDYAPISQSPTTGSGTPSDPLHQVTSYGVSIDSGATDIVVVTQTTTYVNGAQQFHLRWDVHNASSDAVHFKALAAADFFFDGSDRGTGIYTDGPPRFVGGTNSDTGNSGGLAEVTGGGLEPWSAYQALEFGPDSNQVWGKVQGAASTTAPTFDNSVGGDSMDNAGATEWDQDAAGAGLAADATRSFELTVRNAVPAVLQLTPANGGSPQGVAINFTATATNTVHARWRFRADFGVIGHWCPIDRAWGARERSIAATAYLCIGRRRRAPVQVATVRLRTRGLRAPAKGCRDSGRPPGAAPYEPAE